MRSASIDEPAGEPVGGAVPQEPADDRTARARIRDAALRLFAEQGVARTSVRAIAGAADVSAGLVMHHFGSKDNLRVACDQHVAATIRSRKSAAMAAGPSIDPLAALREAGDDPPLLRYLARTLVDGSPHVAELVDEMVADATQYMEQGVATGSLKPSQFPQERAALLTMYSLGALVLHEHLQRHLGVDLTGDLSTDPGGSRYVRAAMEVFGEGVMTDELAARIHDAFASGERTTTS